MPTVKIRNNKGGEGAEVQLSEAVFGQQLNIPLLHQVAVDEAANKRAGTHETKERGDVRGGGRKPFRQKGTGRARQGTIRAPHMRGGGTVFGPHPRSYRKHINKKMRRTAIRQALSDMVAGENLVVFEDHGIREPKTRNAVAFLENLGVAGEKTVIVTDGVDQTLFRAARNLPWARVLPVNELSFSDLLDIDKLVVSSDALQKMEALWGENGKGESR